MSVAFKNDIISESCKEDMVLDLARKSVQVEQLAIVMNMQIDPIRRRLEWMRQEEWEDPEVPELAHSRFVLRHWELGRALASRRRG